MLSTRSRLVMAVIFGVAVLAAIPSARANLIVNGSFEDTEHSFEGGAAGIMGLFEGSTIIPGWTVYNAALAWMYNTNTLGLTTPYGNYFLDLTGDHDSSPYGGVRQDITTVTGQTYILSFSIGTQNPSYPGPNSVMASAGGTSQTFTSDPTGTGSYWETFSMSFVATSATTTVSLLGTASGGNHKYIGLDNVSVEEGAPPVPEPSSLALLGLGGLLGYAGWRRRRTAR